MEIVKYPNDILKQVCEPVTEFGDQLHKALDEMRTIMIANAGMGLAANQVGIAKRFFIMKDLKGVVHEFINPKIVATDGIQHLEEGCLSLPGQFTTLDRPAQVTVEAQDRNGETFKIGAIGLEAVCISHENDHLDGIFYTDKLSRQQRRAILREAGIK